MVLPQWVIWTMGFFIEVNMNKTPALISLLFEARTQAHIFHLQAKSYSSHIALGDYYEGVIDLADSIAENYQGRYEIIKSYPKVSVNSSDPIKFVEQVRSWIDKNRADCCKESEIQNIIDEVQSLNNSTIYKLKNLF